MNSRMLRNLLFGLLGIMLIFVALLAFMTYQENAVGRDSPFSFAVVHHTEIMAVLLIIAVIFGFAAAQFFYREIQKKTQDSKNILGVVLLFLSREEREIVNFLVKQKGATSQAEIARLPHMNRVKAYRSLQRMQEKQIIEIIAHGKVRKVHLKENILSLLLDENKNY